MSSPNAAGSLLLLQELYARLKNGEFLRAATIKGLAIHTASEAGSAPGPDYKFGFGLLNVEKAASVISTAVANNNNASSEHLNKAIWNEQRYDKKVWSLSEAESEMVDNIVSEYIDEILQ